MCINNKKEAHPIPLTWRNAHPKVVTLSFEILFSTLFKDYQWHPMSYHIKPKCQITFVSVQHSNPITWPYYLTNQIPKTAHHNSYNILLSHKNTHSFCHSQSTMPLLALLSRQHHYINSLIFSPSTMYQELKAQIHSHLLQENFKNWFELLSSSSNYRL